MAAWIAAVCGIMCLVWWIDQHYRKWKVKRELAIETCAKEGHVVQRIHAFNDPRFPVDNCTRCPWQTPVRYWCPHCEKEIGGENHGKRRTGNDD